MFEDVDNGSGAATFDFPGLSIAAFTDVAAENESYFADVYNHTA